MNSLRSGASFATVLLLILSGCGAETPTAGSFSTTCTDEPADAKAGAPDLKSFKLSSNGVVATTEWRLADSTAEPSDFKALAFAVLLAKAEDSGEDFKITRRVIWLGDEVAENSFKSDESEFNYSTEPTFKAGVVRAIFPLSDLGPNDRAETPTGNWVYRAVVATTVGDADPCEGEQFSMQPVDGDNKPSLNAMWKAGDRESAGGTVSDADFDAFSKELRSQCKGTTNAINDYLTAQPISTFRRTVIGFKYACPDRLKDWTRDYGDQ